LRERGPGGENAGKCFLIKKANTKGSRQSDVQKRGFVAPHSEKKTKLGTAGKREKYSESRRQVYMTTEHLQRNIRREAERAKREE